MRKEKREIKRKEKNIIIFNLIKIIIFLCLLIGILWLAPNYMRTNLKEEKISMLINNNNITLKLKNDLYMNEKNVVYMSVSDIKNYLDKYIYIDKNTNQIITTYGEKIAVLLLNNNNITINNSTLSLLSGPESKEGELYLPISQMANVYNMDISFIKDENMLILDSLDRKLIKMDASENINLKYKDTNFSKTLDKISKGEKLVLIEKNNDWSKVRSIKGKIGYVKTSKLQNEIYVREDLKTQPINNSKINLVWDYFSEYATAPNRNGTKIKGVNIVSPSFFSLLKDGDGKLKANVGENGINYIEWAKKNNYKVWAMVSNNSYKDTTSKILNSYTLRTNLINNIVYVASQYNLDGINIDFENMNEKDKDLFSRFIIELEPKLKEAGKTLSVDVTAPDGGETWSMCYDRNVIGDVADYIVFMAYDQYGSSSPKEGTTAGYNWVETNLNKFIDREEINPEKIILGIPFYTRLWKEENGKKTSETVNIKDIQKIIPNDIEKTWDEELKQYYIEYKRNNITYKMWIEDEYSIKEKVSLVKKYNLAGVAAWEKDRESEIIWEVINQSLTM